MSDISPYTPFCCSAGCGRTGTLIAIDIFRELLKTKVVTQFFLLIFWYIYNLFWYTISFKKLKNVDMKSLVVELRKQRICMVQSAVRCLLTEISDIEWRVARVWEIKSFYLNLTKFRGNKNIEKKKLLTDFSLKKYSINFVPISLF
jgi:hypothetical protein